MSTSTVGLTDFTAYDLPTQRWMRLIRPKMRLRVRIPNRDFVSAAVKVDDRRLDGTSVLSVHWPWNDDERPCFPDDEEFEVEVERRFLLRYTCVRRTKRTSIDQIRTGDDCALPLYDGQSPADILMLEDGIEMGEITFTLRGDVNSGDVSYEGTANTSRYAEKINKQNAASLGRILAEMIIGRPSTVEEHRV